MSSLDVIFAMGADGLDASTTFNREKAVIGSIVDRQGPSQANYGLVQYGLNSAETLSRLSQFTSNLEFKRLVGNSTLKSPGRAWIPAMNKAREEFESRNAKRKVLVLFANDMPSVPLVDLVKASRSLRSQGVKIIVVFSGSSADRNRLLSIVPTSDDLFAWTVNTQSNVIGSKLASHLFKGLFFQLHCIFKYYLLLDFI